MANFSADLTKNHDLKLTAILSRQEVRTLLDVARRMGVVLATPPADPPAGETPPRPGSSRD